MNRMDMSQLCNDVTERRLPEQVEEMSLSQSLDAVETFLARYVAFASPHQGIAVSLWIAHTYTYDSFETSPILAITSAEKRCGKTRLLDVLELLVWNPWRTVLPSDAVIYRKIEADSPTLILDEADAIFGKDSAAQHEGLRALLNAGNRKGTEVPRVVREGAGFTVVDYAVFGPKAIAGIGTLPDTIADRSIPIRLQRRAAGETIERFRQRDAEVEALRIRSALQFNMVIDDLASARPYLPPELVSPITETPHPRSSKLPRLSTRAGPDVSLAA